VCDVPQSLEMNRLSGIATMLKDLSQWSSVEV
jgi:hypothetical protein